MLFRRHGFYWDSSEEKKRAKKRGQANNPKRDTKRRKEDTKRGEANNRYTVQDMLTSGLNTSFTEKELNALGVIIPDIAITPNQIKKNTSKDKPKPECFRKTFKCQSVICKTMGARKT